ncbi:jun dimerization protein 2 [Ictalurus punctatus]|uniref:Jun dimerization protein 2 n=1 Tax=Ictalurus punctatus TaxID=7998 RepID=A0A2D0PP16_ICTPU|nr:jun dimerization protein 2 [Ictalurus punctatus]
MQQDSRSFRQGRSRERRREHGLLSTQTRVMMPTLSPFAGFPASTLSEQLKLAGILSLQATMTPSELAHPGKRPLSLLQSEMADEEERRKRRREKNKVAAARCRNKKKERTDFLQKESERLEVVNTELKSQIEELKQERQRLIHMLNRHRPTCIVRRDSVQSPESEKNPLLEHISAS